MTAPTPAEIQAARRRAGLTQVQAAAVVHRASRKRWSEWETGAVRMHLVEWELFLLKTRQATIEDLENQHSPTSYTSRNH